MTRLARAVAAASALATAATLLTASPAAAATPLSSALTTTSTSALTATPAARSGWKPRPEQYAETVTRSDLPIRMSDGTVLRADLTQPAVDGIAVARRLPVVVTITAYNKSAQVSTGLGGGADDYLVKRGYAQLTVDARGTGSSEGVWNAFDARESRDAGEIMTWAASQQWSNGRTAMRGPSYMGISQILAASHKPKGLRAIFPQVPAGDVYRDVVASGGQVDVGFIPLWLGLVTTTGLIPPAVATSDPQSALGALAGRLGTATRFTAPTLLRALGGGETAYDGAFYRERSPLRVVGKVDVPTFLTSGSFDIFQRGTPMLYDALRSRGVPTKLVIGPWDHVQASSGEGLEEAGYGTLEELQLRWFDRYVRGVADPTLDSDIAPLTWHEQGTDTWHTAGDWLGGRKASTWQLSGTATNGRAGGLVGSGAQAGRSTVLPVPVQGLCTRSTNQWTAGILRQMPLPNPCLQDNRLNDALGVTFDSAPMKRALRFQGPLAARLWTSTPTGNGMLAVAVEDVAPDGTVTRLTGGWQVISHRALDRSRSRYLGGRLVQPFHPFTREAEKAAKPGEVVPVDVEVFPTGASIRPGHRLRLAVQAYDVPHLLPTVPQLPSALAPLTVHVSPQHPSTLTVPAVG